MATGDESGSSAGGAGSHARPGYTAADRRELEAALHAGRQLRCPSCQHELSVQPVESPATVSYVRHRVWVLCPGCRRTASLDMRPC